MKLLDRIDAIARENPDRVAYLHGNGDATLTYGQLADEIANPDGYRRRTLLLHASRAQLGRTSSSPDDSKKQLSSHATVTSSITNRTGNHLPNLLGSDTVPPPMTEMAVTPALSVSPVAAAAADNKTPVSANDQMAPFLPASHSISPYDFPRQKS